MARRCIFVPGFLGSNLYLTHAGWGVRFKAWVGVGTFALGGYRALDLDGRRPEAAGIAVDVGDVVTAVYGDFLAWLSERFSTVQTYAYDWRLRLELNSAGIRNLVSTALLEGDDVTIIAHSYGGRLVGHATHGMTEPQRAGIRRIVTVGTPWRGSWQAVESLQGRGLSVNVMTNLAAFSMNNLPWVERRYIREVLSSFQSLYELFPRHDLINSLQVPGAPDPWNAAAWFAGGLVCNAQKLVDASEFVQGDYHPFPGIPWVNFYGVGKETVGPLDVGTDMDDSRLRYALDGDGVVPVASGNVAAGVSGISLPTTGEHARLCSSGALLGTLGALLH